MWALGWLSYEAAAGLDPTLVTREADDFPPLWFAFFERPYHEQQTPPSLVSMPPPYWAPTVSANDYRGAVERVKELIRRGDTYQVNYSFRLQARASDDPETLFASMIAVQGGRYSVYIDAGRFVVCCASPETLFERIGDSVTCNPMKGTALRGRFPLEDVERHESLLGSSKDQAENVMIVDMVRNDLARIAQRGSVSTAPYCTIEAYPRVFQMTRRVHATSGGSLSELLRALYPAASITGAPKRRTMEIIAELETTPRRIYTGSVGCITPEGQEVFNVAIRTVLIDRDLDQMEYGVGSGIVWDSEWASEYQECLAKASVVTTQAKRFELFETLLWEVETGFFLLERHIQRLRDSCAYFGWHFQEERVRQELDRISAELQTQGCARRVRIVFDRFRGVHSEVSPLVPMPLGYTVALARSPVDSQDIFLFHKTTSRAAYDDAVPEVDGVDDVILWNERGEVTESRIANVVLDLEGQLVTPPVGSGLLGGCYRAELLEAGRIVEHTVAKRDLTRARAVYLVNSLRKLWPVEVRCSP
jgi:para-aminobenzoate synthetase/4-amino-4-deoxychorismate lyase